MVNEAQETVLISMIIQLMGNLHVRRTAKEADSRLDTVKMMELRNTYEISFILGKTEFSVG